MKEKDVGILGSLLGHREPELAYRTIDGGHPAPYPDMTDEQLYNYEITFNVPRKTFDKPPVRKTAARPHVAAPAGAREEPYLWRGRESEHEVARESARDAAHESTHDEAGHPPPQAEQRVIPPQAPEEKVFDAPRYAARPAATSAEPPAAARLDFSRPVRLITTKQPVEIITTKARHPVYKVHGYIGDDDVVTVFTLDGRLSEHGVPYLENVPQMDKLFLNIYLNQDGISTDKYVVTQHESQEAADAEAAASAAKGKGKRLTCVSVELDV